MVLVPASGWASDPVKREGKLMIDPAAGVIVNTTNGRERPPSRSKLHPANDFTIHPRDVIQVGVARQKPLVFIYKWKGVTLEETADFTAAVAFAGSIQKLFGLDLFQKDRITFFHAPYLGFTLDLLKK